MNCQSEYTRPGPTNVIELIYPAAVSGCVRRRLKLREVLRSGLVPPRAIEAGDTEPEGIESDLLAGPEAERRARVAIQRVVSAMPALPAQRLQENHRDSARSSYDQHSHQVGRTRETLGYAGFPPRRNWCHSGPWPILLL